MGKTSKPLYVIVHDDLLHLPEFDAKVYEFVSMGNRAKHLSSATGDDLLHADMVLGPNMFRILPETVKYFDAAVKGVRATVYPQEKKSGKKGSKTGGPLAAEPESSGTETLTGEDRF